MMSKMFAFSMIFVCFAAVFVDSHQIKVNKGLENRYRKTYGASRSVNWNEISNMSEQQLKEICKSVHAKTNFGVIQDKDLKEVSVQEAYLEFSDPKVKKTLTKVLSCKKNNKEQYVYDLTKGSSKDSVMLVQHAKNAKAEDAKYNGKNVFIFTRRDEITSIPVLQKA